MALFYVNRFAGFDDEPDQKTAEKQEKDPVKKQKKAPKRKHNGEAILKQPETKSSDTQPSKSQKKKQKNAQKKEELKQKRKNLDEVQKRLDELNIEKNEEIGGFTLLKEAETKELKKLKRSLPPWLSNPTVVTGNIRTHSSSIEDIKELSVDVLNTLKKQDIATFFPVQRAVIPAILADCCHGHKQTPYGLRPRDLCVSAPTGSGKTLAYVIPILQCLANRVVPAIRGVVVLPTRDLARQVCHVFQQYTADTNLNVVLLAGHKSLSSEQESLKEGGAIADVVVCTPGRLVDHILYTSGFDLSNTRFLVIDEADRMMDEVKQNWVERVEAAVAANYSVSGVPPRTVTCISVQHRGLMMQKLLFSATLSQNPEKLERLNLFCPRLITVDTIADSKLSTELEEKIQDGVGSDFLGKYTTPAGLTEWIVSTSPEAKPLVLLHFILTQKFSSILCFTNTVESAQRLSILLDSFGGIKSRHFSSQLHAARRQKTLKQFSAGKIDILVCSDGMSRGMDVENVKFVIAYDMSPHVKTYIHRIGRTARAGKAGSAISLLLPNEIETFKKMLQRAGKPEVQKMEVETECFELFISRYKEVLHELKYTIK